MIKLTSYLTIAVIIFITTAFSQTCSVNAGTISSSSLKTFCGGDGIADIVNVTVTGAVGANYRILYADANGVIKIIQQGTSFNFEGMPSTVLNAVGISYSDGLQGLTVGNKVGNFTGCFKLSTTGFTVTVFNKEAGSISTKGSTSATVCVDDKVADILPITYSGFDAFGLMYAVTDLNDNILSMNFNVPNFEGTGKGVVRLRIITSCLETFQVPIGTNINNLPANMDFSNAITVTKNTGCGVTVCAPEVKACPGKVLMCVNGVSTCVDSKQVSKMLKTGAIKGGCVVCKVTFARSAVQVVSNKIADKTMPSISIYPNPTNGFFRINTTATGNVKYELHSATQVVWTKIITQSAGSIPVSLEHLNLAAGIYYLRIFNENSVQTKKLVIVK